MWFSPSLYSEKLHANGQMVQQGERNILETFLLLAEHDNRIEIPRDEADLDGLNFDAFAKTRSRAAGNDITC